VLVTATRVLTCACLLPNACACARQLPTSLALQLDLSLKKKLIEGSELVSACDATTVIAVMRRLEQVLLSALVHVRWWSSCLTQLFTTDDAHPFDCTAPGHQHAGGDTNPNPNPKAISMPGETLLREGDPASRMYFVSRGTLKITGLLNGGSSDELLRGEGGQLELGTLTDGNHFGECALVASGVHEHARAALEAFPLLRASQPRRSASVSSDMFCEVRPLRTFPRQRARALGFLVSDPPPCCGLCPHPPAFPAPPLHPSALPRTGPPPIAPLALGRLQLEMLHALDFHELLEHHADFRLALYRTAEERLVKAARKLKASKSKWHTALGHARLVVASDCNSDGSSDADAGGGGGHGSRTMLGVVDTAGKPAASKRPRPLSLFQAAQAAASHGGAGVGRLEQESKAKAPGGLDLVTPRPATVTPLSAGLPTSPSATPAAGVPRKNTAFESKIAFESPQPAGQR
jgi:CRP-like cAMP-binding protein